MAGDSLRVAKCVCPKTFSFDHKSQHLVSQWSKFAMCTAKGWIGNCPSPSSSTTCVTLRGPHTKEVCHIAPTPTISTNFFSPELERLYGKDIHCPPEWRTWIKTSGVLPDVVIPGATGDILPETVETLMSYLGVSDTCTHGLRGLVYRSLTWTHFSSHAVAQGPLRVLRAKCHVLH